MIEVPGASIFVREVGAGPTALVLHGGLGIDHRMYRGLDRLASALHLVYLDHRGNGRSTGDVATATMRRWADDAMAVADAVAGDGVIVIGHSYGGFIAQEAAIAHGARIAGLILLNTTPGQLGTGEEPAPGGPPPPPKFAELLANMPETDEELAAFMIRLAPAYLHRAPTGDLLELLDGTRFRAAAMKRGFEELARWSAVDRLGRVTAPTLIVAGRHDTFTSWPQAERIAARLGGAEVVVFEDSGHMPWIDEPDLFFGALTGWLHRKNLIEDGAG